MPKFFLSYRRADAEGRYLAHMIFRDLRQRYGNESAFLDVDSRRPGLSFPEKVGAALSSSDAVLVVIGPDWVKCLKERELDERDWVRYEVGESLKREGLPVVPVCLSTTQMPSAQDLPAELKGLALRDGVTLDPFADFDAHLSRLLADLEAVIQDRRRRSALAPIPPKQGSEPPSADESELLEGEDEGASVSLKVMAFVVGLIVAIGVFFTAPTFDELVSRITGR